jgi:hypothetical protein
MGKMKECHLRVALAVTVWLKRIAEERQSVRRARALA